MEKFDHIVVGGGAMGLATAWQLARRGHGVLLLERFEFGHTTGASHGATRNMNNAYADDHYLDLYDLSLAQYRELEADSGETLLTMSGVVTHGDPLRVQAVHRALQARNARTELISVADAEARWPGMRFEGEVMLNLDAGRISAAKVLETLTAEARKHGADLRDRHRVLEFDRQGDTVVVSALSPAGELTYFQTPSLIVTAGAWAPQLLGAHVPDLPPLSVTEEHPAHFQLRPDFAEHEAGWPSFNHLRTDASGSPIPNVYGMLTPGEGIKIGFHRVGPVIEPDQRTFAGSDEARATLHAYVDDWFPGVDTATAEEISCTYTTSRADKFVLDRVDRVTFGAGFGGEGFKFVPAIGRVLADAALGESETPEAFRLAAHRAAG